MGIRRENITATEYEVVSLEGFYGLPEGDTRVAETREFCEVPEKDISGTRISTSDLEVISNLMFNNNNVELLSPGIGDAEELKKEKFPLLLSIIKGVQLQNLEDFLIISHRSSRLGVSPVDLLKSIYPSHDNEFIEAYGNLILECERNLGLCSVNNWQYFAKMLHLLWKKDHDYTAKISKRSKKPACEGWLYGCEFVKNVWLNSISNLDIDDRIRSFERSICEGVYRDTKELDIDNTFLFHELLMEFNVIWVDGKRSWKNQYFLQPDRIAVNVKDKSINVIDNKIGKQFKSSSKFGIADNAQQSLLNIASASIFTNLANEGFLSQFSVADDIRGSDDEGLRKNDEMYWIQNKWMESIFVNRGKRSFPRFELMITPDESYGFLNSTKNYFRDNSRKINELLEVTPNIREGIKDLRKLSEYATTHKQVFRDCINARKKNPWFVMPRFPSTDHYFQISLIAQHL